MPNNHLAEDSTPLILTTNIPLRELEPLTEPFNHHAYFINRPGLQVVGLAPLLRTEEIKGPAPSALLGHYDLDVRRHMSHVAQGVRPQHASELWHLARLLDAQTYGEDGWIKYNYPNVFVFSSGLAWVHGDLRGYWGVDGISENEDVVWERGTRIHLCVPGP